MAAMTSGVAAGRPQPQTTNESGGGPFVRYAQPGRRTQYSTSGVAFGGLVNLPLVAAPGYTRGYRLYIAATGGNATTATAGADSPGNVASLVQLKDAFGTPLVVTPGYEGLQLIQMFGGQFGLDTTTDVRNLPTFSPVAGATGNFTFSTYLPLEFLIESLRCHLQRERFAASHVADQRGHLSRVLRHVGAGDTADHAVHR